MAETEVLQGKYDQRGIMKEAGMKTRVLAVTVMAMLLNAGVVSGDLVTGLVAYYPLDGNANDASGNGRHGVVYGAESVGGMVGGAFQFDGYDDGINLPNNNPVWLPMHDFTIAFWVKFYPHPSPETVDYILDLNLGDSSIPSNELGYGICRWRNSGILQFDITTTTNTDEDLYGQDPLELDMWYHVVALRDGTTQAIYVDGVLTDSRTCSDAPIDFIGGYDDDRVNLGRFSRPGYPSVFNLRGTLDDVRIYDRALSADEISSLVPEPATMALLALGILPILKKRRRD